MLLKDNNMVTEIKIKEPNSPVLYFITGVAGSGKSTLAKKIKEEKNIKNHFEADMWMVDSKGNYSFDSSRLGYCHSNCIKFAEESMIRGEDVIVSNTSLTKKEAKPYFELAKKYKYTVALTHLLSYYGSVHNVPDWKISEMKNKHQQYKIEEV